MTIPAPFRWISALTMLSAGLLANTLAFCPTACGQATPYPDEAHVPPPPEDPISIQEPLILPSGLWLVSSHCSKQSFEDCKPAFCPGVNRYDCGSGYRKSSFAEFQQGIVPGVPVVILVHGSFVTWETVCLEAVETYRWLKRACPGQTFQFVCFTWPADKHIGPTLPLDVLKLGRRASRNGHYLLDLINCLPSSCPVALLGHSHGTRTIASALHLRGGGMVQGVYHPNPCRDGRPIRVVLAAAAIDHEWFNPDERYGRALCSAQCLLNLRNKHDYALKAYPMHRPFAGRALGQSGFTNGDFEEIGRQKYKIRECEVTAQIGHGHVWPLYYNRPELAVLISNHLFFPDLANRPITLQHAAH